MPELGEVRHAREIGKKGKFFWKWLACESCGKQEWKRSTKRNDPVRTDPKICKPCHISAQRRYIHYLVDRDRVREVNNGNRKD